MNNLENYKNKATLTDNEMDAITGELIQGKFNQERRDAWKTKLANQHNIERTTVTTAATLPKKKGKMRVLYLASAIAAAILLAVIALPLLQSSGSSTDMLAMEYLEEPFPNNLIKKDGNASASELRLRATEAYSAEEYVTAAERYQQLIATGDIQVDDYLYLGLSELYTEQFAASVQHLEAAQPLATQSKNFEQEVDWFLSLAYLRNEQNNKAKTLLQKIVESKSWRNQQASALLEQLN